MSLISYPDLPVSAEMKMLETIPIPYFKLKKDHEKNCTYIDDDSCCGVCQAARKRYYWKASARPGVDYYGFCSGR